MFSGCAALDTQDTTSNAEIAITNKRCMQRTVPSPAEEVVKVKGFEFLGPRASASKQLQAPRGKNIA